jgi:hypothetical protein
VTGFAGRGGSRDGPAVNSAIRGAGLVGLAVILGIILLQVIDKGPSGTTTTSSSRGATKTTQATTPKTGGGATTSTPSTTAKGTGARARGEVRVIVFNAGAAAGAAANMTNKLRTLGYQLAPPSNSNPRRGTAVQCKQGFDKEATQLQGDVGPGTTIEPFANPALPGTENVNCLVLLGQ